MITQIHKLKHTLSRESPITASETMFVHIIVSRGIYGHVLRRTLKLHTLGWVSF